MKNKIILNLLIVSLLLFSGASKNAPSSGTDKIIDEARAMILNNYPGEISDENLAGGAIDGMIKSADVFGEYLTPREFTEIENEVKGNFGGVGLVVSVRGDYPKVIKVLQNSPADKSGIEEKDEVIEIDGEKCFRKPLLYIIEKMRGPVGSSVQAVIRKADSGENIQVVLQRANIQIESIKDVRKLSPDIGYIKLAEFVENTREALDEAINILKKQTVSYLILDLRNNMGGSLEAAIAVADKFLDKNKLIVKTDGKNPKDKSIVYSNGKNAELRLPLAILVNRSSASASEIVAGTLQDHGRALIIGEKSFGKGSVQTIFQLSDGSAIKLTTAYYVLPNGRIIEKEGIDPDIKIKFPEEYVQMKEIEERKDSVLDKAVEMINAQKTQK